MSQDETRMRELSSASSHPPGSRGIRRDHPAPEAPVVVWVGGAVVVVTGTVVGATATVVTVTGGAGVVVGVEVTGVVTGVVVGVEDDDEGDDDEVDDVEGVFDVVVGDVEFVVVPAVLVARRAPAPVAVDGPFDEGEATEAASTVVT